MSSPAQRAPAPPVVGVEAGPLDVLIAVDELGEGVLPLVEVLDVAERLGKVCPLWRPPEAVM